MDPKFGEAKQLIFALYNIAFTAVVIVAISLSADMEQNGFYVLQSIGVFWASVFSSCAFVLPRLLEMKQANRILMHSGSRQGSFISGLDLSAMQPGFTSTFDTDDHSVAALSVASRKRSSPRNLQAKHKPPTNVEIRNDAVESSQEQPKRAESKSVRSSDVWGESNDS